MKEFYIWGAKGHAKVLAEIIHFYGDSIKAFIDIDSTIKSPIPNIKVLYSKNNFLLELEKEKSIENIAGIAAIGGFRGIDRFEYYSLFKSLGLITPSLIHPKANVSSNSKIGENNQVCAFAHVGVDAILGHACIINTNATVDHETVLGNGVHIAPGATLCGCIAVGDFVFIGAGATVLPNTKVGSNSIIGAGSLVTQDVPDNVLVYGSPAKIIRKLNNA